jgi:hypothetical protein
MSNPLSLSIFGFEYIFFYHPIHINLHFFAAAMAVDVVVDVVDVVVFGYFGYPRYLDYPSHFPKYCYYI